MIRLHDRMLPDVRIELVAVRVRGGRGFDQATNMRLTGINFISSYFCLVHYMYLKRQTHINKQQTINVLRLTECANGEDF